MRPVNVFKIGFNAGRLGGPEALRLKAYHPKRTSRFPASRHPSLNFSENHRPRLQSDTPSNKENFHHWRHYQQIRQILLSVPYGVKKIQLAL